MSRRIYYIQKADKERNVQDEDSQRERYRDIEIYIERKRDRQTDRQRDRQTDRQRKTERERRRKINSILTKKYGTIENLLC